MSYTVVMPWRPTDPARVAAHDWVIRRWAALAPGVPLLEVDSGHTQFNRAASKNLGLLQAESELVLFADADIVVDWGWLHRALAAASLTRTTGAPALVLVPETCLLYGRRATARVLNIDPDRPNVDDYPPATDNEVEWRTDEAVGGLMLVDRATMLMANGFDERFTGWGWEDVAAAMCVEKLTSRRIHRLPYSRQVHLWHPRRGVTLRERRAVQAGRDASLAHFRRYEDGLASVLSVAAENPLPGDMYRLLQ